jgi:superfamily I DNA and/or RNA helicase
LKGLRILGKIQLPVKSDLRPATGAEKRTRKRIPLERLNTINREAEGENQKDPKDNLQRKIWKLYIQAKRKFLGRLSTPVKIVPTTLQLTESGILKAQIDTTVREHELNRLIIETFTINEIPPSLAERDAKLAYFTIPTVNGISSDKLEAFKEGAAAFYLDFSALPAIEGVFSTKNGPYPRFKRFLDEENIALRKDRDGKFQISLMDIKKLDEYIKKDKNAFINRSFKIGCVIGVKPTGPLKKLEVLYDPRLFIPTIISDCGFTITSKTFSTNIFTEIEILCSSTVHRFQVIFKLRKISVETFQTIIFPVLDENKWVEAHDFTEGELTVMLTCVDLNQASNVYHNLYHQLSSLASDCSFSKVTVFYKSDKPLLIGQTLKTGSFDEDFLQHIRKKLPTNSGIEINNNSISFDFSTEDELVSKLKQVDELRPLLDLDWRGDHHRMKVEIEFQNPYAELEAAIKHRFKTVRTRYYQTSGTFHVRYHYKYHVDNQNFLVTQLGSFCEELAQMHKLSFTLNNPFEIKFFAEVNEELKKFEENERFSKLRGAEVSFENKVIGKIFKCNYPQIEIKVNEFLLDSVRLMLSERMNDFSYIKPELKGEVEKIARLEKAIEKIELDAPGLPNPKVAQFIYDSSRAKEIEKNTELLKGSPTWEEILFHKNDSSNLNDSQIRGVISTLLAEDLALIQGPPGTGKSTAISEIIWQHIRRQSQQRILLTSETHLAVDNALEKVGKLKSNLVRPIRFGVEEDDFDLEDTLEDEEELPKVEGEGKRYGAGRILSWASSEPASLVEQRTKDNAVQIWMGKIAENSLCYQSLISNEVKQKWVECLKKASKDLKELFSQSYFRNVNVVGATSSSIAEKNTEGKPTKFTRSYCDIFQTNRRTPNIFFDVVITDEASKATPPELLLPLLYGKKSVIVGDHRQLPPMLDENDFSSTLKHIGEAQLAREFAKTDINESQFERLFEGLNKESTLKTTFDLQYRMHSSINQVIEQFYKMDGSGLHCGLSSDLEDYPDLSNPQSRWHGISHPALLDENTHCVWVNVEHPEILEGTSRVNWGEIEACKRILLALQKAKGFQEFQNFWNKEEEKEIGLISFYGRQISLLRKMVREDIDLPLRISTVDRFQGMERNIVIVSMVRSSRISTRKDDPPDFDAYPQSGGYEPQDSLGFAELPNRLNVALSRAKRLLIIVGDAAHFSKREIYQNVYNVISNSQHGRVISDYKTLQA